jgi:hypothetical protein
MCFLMCLSSWFSMPILLGIILLLEIVENLNSVMVEGFGTKPFELIKM